MLNDNDQRPIRNPSWWRRRSKLERLLLITIIGVIILSVVLVAIAFHSNQRTDDEASLCLTPECVKAASKLLQFMDTSVNPCDDFYQFACGSFIKNTIIPEDQISMSSMIFLAMQMKIRLKTILEEPIGDKEAKPFRQLKTLYSSCMNKEAIENIGLQIVNGHVQEIGGWPIIKPNWKEKDFDWMEASYKLKNHGYPVHGLIRLRIGADSLNSSTNIIEVEEGIVDLGREFLLKGFNETIVQLYYQFMVKLAVAFGANKSVAERETKASIEFEMELAKIKLKSEQRRNISTLYNPMTITELSRQYKTIPWQKYINNMLDINPKVTNNQKVTVAVPNYLRQLERLLFVTPRRIIANYIIGKVIISTSSFLTEEIRNLEFNFTSTVTGVTKQADRWTECASIANSMSLALASLYVRKYFDKNGKIEAVNMIDSIKEQLQKSLEKLEWMDEQSKDMAIKKVSFIDSHIGYPDELLNDTNLIEYYDGISVDHDNYYMSMLNLSKFVNQFDARQFWNPIKKRDWHDYANVAVVNAFYHQIDNSINFPAGILQANLFHKNQPGFMNYGGIGSIMGHEVIHSIDDKGKQRDQYGNVVNWWTSETAQTFTDKAQCIIDQYDNYTIPGTEQHLRGEHSQGENIADNGGIKIAYLGYVNSKPGKAEIGTKLPGLDYNSRQLFWLAAANVWCEKSRPEAQKLLGMVDPHPPGMFRVLGPFSNSGYFAKDFKCPLGSVMNPVDKCNMW